MGIAFGVYYWLCRPTGKMYIGSSVNTLSRENAHRGLLRRGKHHSLKLQRAWNKYGEGAFEFDLLDVHVCLADLAKVEEALIAHYDTYRNGYNHTPLSRGNPGGTLPPELRAKMSEGAKRAGTNLELRRQRSERAKAQHANGGFGIHWTKRT